MPDKRNLFENIPAELPAELIEEIVTGSEFRAERIISRGHASPDGFWYDQEENELVVLLQGSAGLRLENQDELIVLQPGDYLLIPGHCRHRVEWTDTTRETIWLALHYKKA